MNEFLLSLVCVKLRNRLHSLDVNGILEKDDVEIKTVKEATGNHCNIFPKNLDNSQIINKTKSDIKSNVIKINANASQHTIQGSLKSIQNPMGFRPLLPTCITLLMPLLTVLCLHKITWKISAVTIVFFFVCVCVNVVWIWCWICNCVVWVTSDIATTTEMRIWFDKCGMHRSCCRPFYAQYI